MTNIYETNDLVDFLDKHKMTSRQFMYCILLYHDKKYSRIPGTNKISRPLSQIYKYHSNVEKFTKEDLNHLVKIGFIQQVGNKIVPDMLEITDTFKKVYLGDMEKFDELWNTYPEDVENFNHPSKPRIPLKLVKDHYATSTLYNKFVKTNKNHKRVIEAVEWGKENNKINMSIERFVSSKAWEYLWSAQDSSVDVNTQYEII